MSFSSIAANHLHVVGKMPAQPSPPSSEKNVSQFLPKAWLRSGRIVGKPEVTFQLTKV